MSDTARSFCSRPSREVWEPEVCCGERRLARIPKVILRAGLRRGAEGWMGTTDGDEAARDHGAEEALVAAPGIG
ncbi:MAG: hypothetical protein H6828_12710 [Planctomycetes bacterium]|nr:hypothetical protein [Planctomycetota bacterium]